MFRVNLPIFRWNSLGADSMWVNESANNRNRFDPNAFPSTWRVQLDINQLKKMYIDTSLTCDTCKDCTHTHTQFYLIPTIKYQCHRKQNNKMALTDFSFHFFKVSCHPLWIRVLVTESTYSHSREFIFDILGTITNLSCVSQRSSV